MASQALWEIDRPNSRARSSASRGVWGHGPPEHFVILDFLKCSLVHFLSDKSAPQYIKCNTMRTGGRDAMVRAFRYKFSGAPHNRVIRANKMG